MCAASLPAHEETAESVVPGVRSLHDPPPRLAAHHADQRLLAASSNMRADAAQTDGRGYVRVVVALVETEMLGTPRTSGAAHDDGIEDFTDHRAVWHVGAGDECGERDAATVGQNVAFDATFRAVRRIWAREVPPFGAFTEALSSEAQAHSMPRSSS